jgi:hypothetical protein
MTRLAVVVESGARRTFAGAIDWPGWSRSGTSEEQAIATLLAYAGRYRRALEVGSVPPPLPPSDGDDLEPDVVERMAGGSGTDFGVPSHPPRADERPLDAAGTKRLVAILEAGWATFDRAVDAAEGHELRLGPRGGGRDLERIVDHVREADRAYLTQLGVRAPRLAGDASEVEQAVRRRAADVLPELAAGAAIADANDVKRTWPPRVYVRRAVWHALDHAWEIEDRRID